MEEKTCLEQVKAAIPIRIRGMSSQNRFFDEQTETDWVGKETVTSHLRTPVELDTEVHLINMRTNVGGTFRVIWTNTREVGGFHSLGLELIEPEGELWAMAFPTAEPGEEGVLPQVSLVCQRCHQRLLSAVPEARGEFLREGFRVARHCELCRATTPWSFTVGPQSAAPTTPEGEAEAIPRAAEAPPAAGRTRQEDQRAKGRAPLQMAIKVTRKKYGTTLEEVCQTINISRNGVYFRCSQNYEIGEDVDVVLNYKEGDLALSVPAKVVRLGQPKDTFQKGVAIQLKK